MSEDKELLVPEGTGMAELEIKKSKFIGQCFYVADEKESKTIITEIRLKHKSASHVVYAFITGPENSRNMGMSDDGEPKGTAGKPVLQVLKGSGITNILCTVVRYFGGVKLGTGGLVKAYTDTSKEALHTLKIKKQVKERSYSVITGYEYYDHVRRAITDCEGAKIVSEIFADTISIKTIIPDLKISIIKNNLSDITSGKIVINALK